MHRLIVATAIAILATLFMAGMQEAPAQTLSGTITGTFGSFSHDVDGGAGDGGEVVPYTLLAFSLPSAWSSLDLVAASVIGLVDQGWGNTFAGNTIQVHLLHSGSTVWNQQFGHANHTPTDYTLSLAAGGTSSLFSVFQQWQPLGQLSLAVVGTVAGWPGAELRGSGGSLEAVGVVGGTTTISGSTVYSGTTAFDANAIALTGTLTAGTVIIGNTNSGISFVIEASGNLSDAQTIVGNGLDAAGNSLTVSGAGAAWTGTGGFTIGNSGTGNALTIAAGGFASMGNGIQIVGSGTTATGNTLVVTGTGSVLQSTAALKIGYNGDDNSLLVENGGGINGSFAIIGDNLGQRNTATVTGLGSSWTASNSVFVGNTGSQNTLFVLAGGSVSGNVYVAIGQNPSSNGNMATVSGSGSMLTTTGALAVGNGGDGNVLVIGPGGTVSDNYGVIGAGATAGGNSVLVSGSGALWTNATAVDVGYSGTGSLLTIADGGVVTAPLVNIGYQLGSSGTLVIGGGAAAGTLDAPSVVFGAGAGSLVFSHTSPSYTLASAVTGAGNVVQSGPGTTILSATSTYTGPTSVTGGGLAVSGAIVSSPVTVAGGWLGGDGLIGGPVAILAGGTLAPGASIGTLTTGSLTLAAESTTAVQLGTPGTRAVPGMADLVVVTGPLSLGGTLAVADNAGADGLGSIGAGSYMLFQSTGVTSGTFATVADVVGYRGEVVTAAPVSGTTSTYLDNYMLASATSQQTVFLPAWHAGSGTSAGFVLTNLSNGNAAYTESLSSGTFTATTPGFFASGSATGIAGGTSAGGTLLAGITGTAAAAGGVYTGSTTVQLISNPVAGSGLAPVVVGTQIVTITGTAWNLADAVYVPDYDFGDVHVGDVAFLPVVVTNAAAANGFSEGLNMQWNLTDSVDATLLGQITNLPAGQSTLNLTYAAYQALSNGSDDFMAILLNTASTGDKQAEFGVAANSTGATTSGLGLTSLAEDPITVSGAVYAYAAPVVSASGTTLPQPTATLSLGSVHVGGDVPVVQLSLFNDGNGGDDDGFTEGLAASFTASTGNVAGVGAVANLAPGATSSALGVRSSAATGGAFGGSVTLGFTSVAVVTSDLDDTELAPMTITVTGTGYAYASPSASAAGLALPAAGATLDLGTVRVGSAAPSQTLTITNNGTANGYTESLDAVFGAGGAVISGSGSISGLAAGSASAAMSVFASTATSGTFTQEVQVQYTSVAVPGSGLGNTVLQPQGISVTVTVNALAVPTFTSESPYFGGSGQAYTIDFGTVEVGADVSAIFSLGNIVSAPADSLAGQWDIDPVELAQFTFDGFADFGLTGMQTNMATAIAPGSYQVTDLTVLLDTEVAGTFSGSIVLTPYSVNSFQSPYGLTPITIGITAVVQEAEHNSSNDTGGNNSTSGGSDICGGGCGCACGCGCGGDGQDGGGNNPVIPEPSSGVILLTGFVGLAAAFRRRQWRLGRDATTSP